MIVKSVALALRDVPEVNATWNDDHIRIYKNADISIAVSTGKIIFVIIFILRHWTYYSNSIQRWK